MSDLLTPEEFGKEIGHSTGFVYKLIHAGEIEVENHKAPGAKLPQFFIHRDQAKAWRASRRTRLTPREQEEQAARRRTRRPAARVVEVIR